MGRGRERDRERGGGREGERDVCELCAWLGGLLLYTDRGNGKHLTFRNTPNLITLHMTD